MKNLLLIILMTTGFSVYAQINPSEMEHKKQEMQENLIKKLDLSDVQQKQVKEIDKKYQNQETKLKEIIKQTSEDLKKIRKEKREEYKKILTPEQKSKLEIMKEERKETMKEFRKKMQNNK